MFSLNLPEVAGQLRRPSLCFDGQTPSLTETSTFESTNGWLVAGGLESAVTLTLCATPGLELHYRNFSFLLPFYSYSFSSFLSFLSSFSIPVALYSVSVAFTSI